MSYTNRQLIENALKRVNALVGADAKLYKDNTGWFIRRNGCELFDEQSRSAADLLSYLHGLEDAIKYERRFTPHKATLCGELQKIWDSFYHKGDFQNCNTISQVVGLLHGVIIRNEEEVSK